MKKTKKILAMACAMALSAAIAVGGTLAYLTDKTTEVKNTFTVGNVTITLDEAKVDEYGQKLNSEDKIWKEGDTLAARVTANEYKLIPGHNYVKDPTVHVDENSENCWLFVKVVNDISAIEADTTIADQMAAGDSAAWAVVDATNNIYAYKTQVEAGRDITVFNTFTLKDNADVEKYASAQITIQAYAIQADGFDTYTEAWETGANSTWPA